MKPQLFQEAQNHRVGLLYEAASAGGIQVVDDLLNKYSHNHFSSFAGIVNGTTNHMLTEMPKGKNGVFGARNFGFWRWGFFGGL